MRALRAETFMSMSCQTDSVPADADSIYVIFEPFIPVSHDRGELR